MAKENKIQICEVSLRDGLQNEKVSVSTQEKSRLFDLLWQAGARKMELTSFVHPKVVPQMADAEAVVEYVNQKLQAEQQNQDSHNLMTLVINEKGYDRALAAGAQGVSLVMVCTESFCEKNNRMSIAQCTEVTTNILRRAKADGLKTRVNFSVAWICPYEGEVKAAQVLPLVEQILLEDPEEIVLADTVGRAQPLAIASLCEQTAALCGMARLTLHVHDTSAFGLANCTAAVQAGVRSFDSSAAGLGGCPFAPGAAGNVATEDLVFLVEQMGFETDYDLGKLRQVVLEIDKVLGRRTGGRTRELWEKSDMS